MRYSFTADDDFFGRPGVFGTSTTTAGAVAETGVSATDIEGVEADAGRPNVPPMCQCRRYPLAAHSASSTEE
jgi:hypothetical protein